MTDLLLYTRPGCHLCEQAAQVVRAAGNEPQWVDISGDVGLLRDYGTRIPVVRRRDTGEEIGWPFDAADVRRLVTGPGPAPP